MLERRIISAEGPIVVKVNVALPPVLVTVTGIVLPNEQVGAGLTTGAMLHESVTVPVYPLAGTTLTVAEAELPGLSEVGLAVPAESAYPGVRLTASTTPFRWSGNVKLSTVLVVLRTKE